MMNEIVPHIPVRMLSEYVYCPRVAYMMWVQGEFADNSFTVEGRAKHKAVDAEGGKPLPEAPAEDEVLHSRSVSLGSEKLGLVGKLDLVEGEGKRVTPIDYKRGKRPHVPGGVYDPERVQLCAQGLLLREHGFECDEGVIYFAGSRGRVRVPFDDELEGKTHAAIRDMRDLAAGGCIPAPLEDSPKCPRCSLIGICLPDEVRFLNRSPVEPRPIVPMDENGLPLYIQSPRAYVRKDGERFRIEVEKEKVAEARIGEVSQVVLFGNSALTTGALHECFRREIPVSYLTYGGWFVGHAMSAGKRNVETRTAQYGTSFDPAKCLALARRWVAAKIVNCRTLLRRNWRGGEGDEKAPPDLLFAMQADIRNAMKADSIEALLGVEGASAGRYFKVFGSMLKSDAGGSSAFDFESRNRRPPKDPVNAMLPFAYSMLVRELVMALSAVGLDPYRGFYHQQRFGRPSLALDMMEPFRPLVADSAVLMAINNGELRPGDFMRAAGGCSMNETGRKKFIAAFERRLGQEVTHPIFRYRISYRRLFEVQARLLARHLCGEIPAYPNFVTR